MMSRYDAQVAATVIGLAGFQLLEAWNKNAPSLTEVRTAHFTNDIGVRQRLQDADFMVGGIALILGITFALLTHDMTALIVMIGLYGSVSLWFHSVLKADPR